MSVTFSGPENRERPVAADGRVSQSGAPLLSIVIPVHNQAELLRRCLASVRDCDFEDYEIIVSDDGSDDPALVQRAASDFGAAVIRSEIRRGSAAARNRGAAAAQGEHIVFFDSDVSLHSDTLNLLSSALGDRTDAVFGSYDHCPAAPGLSSQFRNLMHTHVHQNSRPEARSFWTACGAVRRDLFVTAGGFDERYLEPSVEDAEFGMRIHKAGARIRLLPEVQVTHHKRWTFSAMVKTDFFLRAVPWAALLREHGFPRDLNFRMKDRAAVALSALALPVAIVAARHGAVWWMLFALCLLVPPLLQNALLRYFRAVRGLRFAALCVPLLLVYNLVCAAGLVAGLIDAERRRDRWFLPVTSGCIALVTALQTAGGAWWAEFAIHGDEPRHFVSGLMVYDYLAQVPWQNPVRWAARYYLHYPLVSIGHWPPGYYVMEAFWWLLFTPSRVTGIALQTFLAAACCVLLYRILRELAPGLTAGAAALLLMASPVLQQSYDMSMADLACMLGTLFLMRAVSRLVVRTSRARLATAAGWIIFTLLIKGSGACLIPVPAVALLIAGRWKTISRSWLLLCLAGIAIGGLGWYAIEVGVFRLSLARFAGMSTRAPWRIDLVPGLLGYGFLALACAGLPVALVRRRPVALAAAATLASVVAASTVLRAMAEPRHWIIVMPALVILAVEFLMTLSDWLRMRRGFLSALAGAGGVGALVALALLTYPFTVFRQHPGGFANTAGRIPRPARIMTSAAWDSEGALIVAVSLTEARPGSVVVRASEALSSSGLHTRDYQLLTKTPDQVERRLDELGIERVAIYRATEREAPPEEAILFATMRQSISWKPCNSEPELLLYCRTHPPSWPRKPLEIDLPKFNLKFSE